MPRKLKRSSLQTVKRAGLIHEIPVSKLKSVKPKSATPKEISNIVKLITIHDPNLSEINRLGSSTFSIQKYFSDVDINDTITIEGTSEQVTEYFLKEIRALLYDIYRNSNVYFSDFKAGVDNKGESVHWTLDQLLSSTNDEKLIEAFQQESVIKVDIIAPYGDRFIEASTFFILANVNEKGKKKYLNIPDDFFVKFTQALKKEVIKYANEKPFKAVKRLWSLGRVNNDLKLLKKLAPMIDSNLSLLSQINADLETLILMLEKIEQLPTQEMAIEVDQFKERLATIADIELPLDDLDMSFNDIRNTLMNGVIDMKTRQALIQSIETVHDFLLKVINKETNAYLKHIKLNLKSIV